MAGEDHVDVGLVEERLEIGAHQHGLVLVMVSLVAVVPAREKNRNITDQQIGLIEI